MAKKLYKRALALLLSLVMMQGLFYLTGVRAASGVQAPTDIVVLNSAQGLGASLNLPLHPASTGWYKLSGSVEFAGRLTISGTVHLILEDGSHWKNTIQQVGQTRTGGIYVPPDSALHIHAQSSGTDMGRLTLYGGFAQAAIGGDNGDSGSIYIHGGNITATGGVGAAGIGGGWGGSGRVSIYGGVLIAIGGEGGVFSPGSPGIGSGSFGTGASVTIHGGDVTATGSGTGYLSAPDINGNIAISGGNVHARIQAYQGHTATPPAPLTENGITAAITLSPTGSLPQGMTLTATLTLSGTATEAGVHTLALASTELAGQPATPITRTVTAGDTMGSEHTILYRFPMPNRAVTEGDFIFTHSFAPSHYAIALHPTSHDFGNVFLGDAPPPALTVTVENTGNQPTGALAASLTGAGASAFAVNTTSGSDTNSFTVRPVAGLGLGTHTATLTLAPAPGNPNPIAPQSVAISVTVIPRPPAEAPPVQPPQQPPPVQETASPTEAPDSPTPTPPENVEPTEEPGHKIEPEHETKPESKTEPEPVFTFTEDEDPRAVILYANETHIANLIANAENNAVVFDFSGFDGVESAAIPAFAPGRIAYAGLYVVIRLPHGTIIFDPESARCASAQAQGGDISLALFPLSAHSNALSGAQQNALREGDALFHIALTSGEDYIRAFENGMLTVTVPFGGPFPAAVWFLDERGGLSTMLGLYCAEAGTASFVTRHLSVYIVRHFWRNPFTDVNESDPFFPAIRFVKENTLIEGTSLDTFSPDGYLSRATAVRILWHAAGKPRNDAPHIFTDVADGDEAIRWAAAKGIVVGVGDNRFAPRDYISHRHMLLLLSGYAHYFGYVMPGGLCVENAPRERVTRGEAAMLIYLLFSGD